MEIIPVIDLSRGQVVHARRGERACYQPIVSGLSASSTAVDVVDGLLGLYPFDTLYIADLDAIQGLGDHACQIRQLRAAFPALTLWLDGGFELPEQLVRWQQPGITCVIGSERLRTLAQYRALIAAAAGWPVILSLDYHGETLLGPPSLHDAVAEWPDTIICMTLHRVGSDAGPDTARLAHLAHLAGEKRCIAAGGVRGEDDLSHLRRAGAAGTLVASALHDGRLDAARIARSMLCSGKKNPGP